MTGPWHRALAWALTGEGLPLGSQGAPDADALAEALAASGWDAARLASHAADMAEQGRPWPHPIPEEVRAGLGAAQLHAALAAARGRLGLTALTVLPPSRRTRLDADERRLLADVPPHFGRT